MLHWAATGQRLWNSVTTNVEERCEPSCLVFFFFFLGLRVWTSPCLLSSHPPACWFVCRSSAWFSSVSLCVLWKSCGPRVSKGKGCSWRSYVCVFVFVQALRALAGRQVNSEGRLGYKHLHRSICSSALRYRANVWQTLFAFTEYISKFIA